MGGIATVLVASCAICTPALATPSQADVSAAQTQLDSLGSELSSLQDQLATITSDAEQTDYDINEADAKIAETQTQLDAARKTLGDRVATSYKSGGTGILDIILGSDNISDLISRIYYVDKVNEQDAANIATVQQLQTQLSDQKTALEQKKAEQQADLDDMQAKVDDYQAKVADAQSYYESLDAEVQAQVQAEQNANVAAAVTAVQQNTATTNDTSSDDSSNDSSSNGGSSSSGSGGHSYSGGGLSSAYGCIGKPYVWGATGPNSFDCSGLVCYCYGYGRGRDTYSMIASLKASGDWKTSLSDLQVGDLVFPADYHVGIYIGDGMMIHAPKPGDVVKVASVYAFIGGGTY